MMNTIKLFQEQMPPYARTSTCSSKEYGYLALAQASQDYGCYFQFTLCWVLLTTLS